MGKHEGGKKETFTPFKPDKDQSRDGAGDGGGTREKPADGGKK
ncbi:hypothetical protein ACIBQX_28090 [Nonomuraea sp. NPDC049714]